MLEISEIFNSLQGEGPFTGRPATFIRLSGCREPYCPWCDTPYAREKGRATHIERLLEQVAGFKNSLVVITGGEPFLQWKTGLGKLEQALINLGHTVQYETSGKAGIPTTVKGHVVCSPKFIGGRWYFDPENLPRVDDFKFVVSDDFQAVEDFIQAHAIPKTRVWIMPLGATRTEQLQRLATVWKFCADRKYNFSPRLHILAFDNERGI
jgi:7-carboxy-7-deazaguanine synthase